LVYKAAHTKIKGVYYLFLLVVVFLLSCKKPSPVKIGTVNGATAVCLGEDSVVYTLNATEAVDYVLWTVPKEAEITSGQGTGTITVKFGRVPGNICAILYNDGEPVSESACLNVSFGVVGEWCRESNFGGGERSRAVAFAIGSKGYITTGYSKAGENGSSFFFNDLWEYDTETFAWRQRADFPDTPRIAAVSFVIGGKAYVGTGYKGTGGSFDNFLNDFWEYNSVDNKWTQKQNVPGTPRQYAFAFSIGNKGYIGSGQFGLGQDALNDFYEYNPVTDVWVQKNNIPLPLPRIAPAAFSIGNKGYVGLGQNPVTAVFLNDFYEYDPGTDTWVPKAAFPDAARYSAAVFASSTKGYVLGGFGNSTVYDDFWEYDPLANNWDSLPDMNRARGNSVGFTINDKIYFGIGNVSASEVLNDWWVYTLN
jgi:N-acetylneuraminic acid mutarotase